MISYSIFDNSILRFKTKILSNTLLLLLFLVPLFVILFLHFSVLIILKWIVEILVVSLFDATFCLL
jgi:hypothetical protein